MSPRFHALLIGIDAYRAKPLRGCVNDADSMRKLLVERAGLPPEDIRCLVSPHPGAVRAAAPSEEPATLANLRAALAELAGRARDGDRVLLYFSGHGVRAPISSPDGVTTHREALVPIDVDASPERRLLFDHEINRALTGLAGSVTCILDCCHSAGITRDPWMTSRSLDVREDLGWTSPLQDPDPAAPAPGIARAVDDCHVVCACLAHELAMESRGDDGVPHGLLTYALLKALGAIADADLATVRWSGIWQAMRAALASRNAWQHLWMAGSLARPVLGGGEGRTRAPGSRPADADPGLSIRRDGDAYEIDAGTLASVTESALIAVYGDEPAEFPPIGTGDDRAARLGLLRVTSAQLGTARAAIEGAPFELPPGARGRIVELGRAPRLRCAILPPSEALTASLAASPLIELVGAPQAQVRLEQAGGRWLVTDDLHTADPAGALLALGTMDLPRVGALLEHYHRYTLPLRMAESARDLPGALRLSVLLCEARLAPAAAQVADLPEAPTAGTSRYDLESGTRVCLRLHNASDEPLRVTLVNSASSGRVQILGDEVLEPAAAHTFWSGNVLGKGFALTLPAGRPQGIDRITAIGTTDMDRDLRYLGVGRRFSHTLNPPSTKDLGDDKDTGEDDAPPPAPIERWTAAQAIIRTRAR